MSQAQRDFPLRLFEYDSSGRYGDSRKINSEDDLLTAMEVTVKKAIAEKREVRITDTADLLVFHAKDGLILYPERAT